MRQCRKFAPTHELCAEAETAKMCTQSDVPVVAGNAQVLDLTGDLARNRKVLQLPQAAGFVG
jgi:hypothetical protein